MERTARCGCCCCAYLSDALLMYSRNQPSQRCCIDSDLRPYLVPRWWHQLPRPSLPGPPAMLPRRPARHCVCMASAATHCRVAVHTSFSAHARRVRHAERLLNIDPTEEPRPAVLLVDRLGRRYSCDCECRAFSPWTLSPRTYSLGYFPRRNNFSPHLGHSSWLLK